MKTDCYIGRAPCGCIEGVTSTRPGREKDTAKDVAKFIRQGLKVEPAVWKDVMHDMDHSGKADPVCISEIYRVYAVHFSVPLDVDFFPLPPATWRAA